MEVGYGNPLNYLSRSSTNVSVCLYLKWPHDEVHVKRTYLNTHKQKSRSNLSFDRLFAVIWLRGQDLNHQKNTRNRK